MSVDSTITISDIYQGNQRDLIVTIKTDSAPVNITNDSVDFIVKALRTDSNAAAVIHKVNPADSPHTNPTQGETTFILDQTDTNIPIGIYYFEITHISSTNAVKTLASGRLKIIDPIRDPV
jgi:hypothetical protein